MTKLSRFWDKKVFGILFRHLRCIWGRSKWVRLYPVNIDATASGYRVVRPVPQIYDGVQQRLLWGKEWQEGTYWTLRMGEKKLIQLQLDAPVNMCVRAGAFWQSDGGLFVDFDGRGRFKRP